MSNDERAELSRWLMQFARRHMDDGRIAEAFAVQRLSFKAAGWAFMPSGEPL